jgi:hydroxymethylpyrimidine/phosphomethylpyrimidine kinase
MDQPRTPAPVSKPVVLTIAGSDSGGGAGVQADLKTIEASGGFGTAAITAVTAQNTTGVQSSHVLPVAELEAQIEAVRSDVDVRAVKTGMLATDAIVEAVASHAAAFDCPVVVDPVMVAESGDRLLDADAEAAYEDLIAEATLVTPNADEAAVLTDVDAGGSGHPDQGGSGHPDEAGARLAGQRLRSMGADAALVTGGHVPGDEVVDVLVTADGVETARHARVDTDATHGSGCTLSAAIATHLARGESLDDAVHSSVAFLERAIRYHHDVGEGPGAVHHSVALRNEAARNETAEAVEAVVERLVAEGVRPLVPEVGTNVVGATPYAEAVDETAAVEGRITKTMGGVQPNRGVRFGASSHVARFLLAAREYHPELRFAVNCRFDDDVEAALESLEWDVAEYDRDAEPDDVKRQEGSTMQWGARQVFGTDDPPVAVVDRGEVGKEAIVKLVAASPIGLSDRVVELLHELAS